MRTLKRMLVAAVCAVGLLSAHAAVTVTTVDELLTAAADTKSGTVILASPDGTYPVTYMMTDSVFFDGCVTLCGATGNRDDVILDFSNVSGYGVRINGSYKSTLAQSAFAHSFTVQNATNLSATATLGGGLMVNEGCISNVVVRNCFAGTPSGTTGEPHGGGINMSGRFGVLYSVISNCAAVAGYYEAGGGGVWARNAGVLDHTLITNCYIKGGNKSYGGGFGATQNYTFKHSQIVDCHNLKGTDACGGGVRVNGNSSSTVTNCLFAGNTCVGKGGAFYLAYTTSNNKVSDSTFVDNSSAGEGGALNIQYADVWNCKFVRNKAGSGSQGGGALIVNGGSLKCCLFQEGEAGQGGGASGRIGTILHCVFKDNKALGTSGDVGGAGGLFWGGSGAMSNSSVEDCLFDGNSAVASGAEAVGGGAIGICFDNNAQTNLHIRGCYFVANTNDLGASIAVRRIRSENLEPTFENGYGLNIESCTFDETLCHPAHSLYVSCGSYLAGASVFVRNCHFKGTSSTAIANTSGWNGWEEKYPGHIRYCVADVDMPDLPTAGDYKNAYGTKVRNKGQNQDWMLGAQDIGDGTYTLGTSADYGVTIAFNNRRPRILNDIVDIGCFESPAPGLMLLLK